VDRAELSARRWAETWARGWATHDAASIAALYADDAVFVSEPFRAPARPAEYAEWAFADEVRAEVWFAEPLGDRDRASVAWWAISESVDGRATTLAGVSTLWFDAAGLVTRQFDYWNAAEDAAQPPPDGWGPVAAHERPD